MFTTSFFIIFMLAVIVLFYGVRREWRVTCLTIASLVFLFYIDTYAAIVLILMSLITYGSGYGIRWFKQRGGEKAAKNLLRLMLLFYSSLMLIYKFGFSFLNHSRYLEGISKDIGEYLIIPIGFSFYTFGAISYLVDLYKERYQEKESFMEFMLYMSFFAKLVSGPIENAEGFIRQLKGLKEINFWHSGRLSVSFAYLLYGYFMKIVIADRVAMIVNRLFEYPQGYDSFWLLMGIILYTFQIYTDFAGYSFIAVGVAKIFGINIQLNFKNPYFASGISEFWRKWHISLSSWLKNYLYIPLGGNRKGELRKNINVLLVFIVCGVWHGNGFSFLIWGILHGIYSIAENLILYKNKNRFLGNMLLLVEVSFAWIFFRASSASAALNYIWQLLIQGTNWGRISEGFHRLDLNAIEICIIVVSIIIILTADGWANKYESVFPMALQTKPQSFRYCIFYALLMLIFIFGIYGSGYNSESFIYMQF